MNQTVVITGASGAIAKVVSKVFKDANWQLALFANSQKGLETLQQTCPSALVVQADLSREEEAQTAISKTLSHLGHIDALLNIAGGFAMSSATDTSTEHFEQQLSINLRTLVNTSKAVLPSMLARRQGFILGVGASAGLHGGANMASYAASKGAATSYLKSVRAEVEPKGIGVSIVYPMGAVDTPGNRENMPKTDPTTWIDPHSLAESIFHLCTRGPRGRIRELKIYPPP